MTSPLLVEADRLHDLEQNLLRTIALRENGIAGGRGAIYDLADRFRHRLDRLEADAIATALTEWRRIAGDVDTELRRLDRLLKAGSDTAVQDARDLLANRRDAIVRQIDSYARTIQGAILDRQQTAAQLAGDEQAAIVGRQLGRHTAGTTLTFGRLAPETVEQILGQLASAPMRRLLDDLGGTYADRLARELTDGMVYGRNPRDVARRLTQHADMPRWKALEVSRTEIMRAYRETARRTVLDNRDVIGGTTWLAQLDEQTCIACWDMHGTQHPPGYTMASHPSCRCVLVPRTKSWAELGLPDVTDTPSLITTDGPTLFARQPVRVQRSVLGPARLELYRQGVTLDDMVGFRTDPEWGPTSFIRPIAQLAVPTPAG